jgi:hypothetical protein
MVGSLGVLVGPFGLMIATFGIPGWLLGLMIASAAR